MSAHVLDRPVWSALTTRQAAFAIGDDRARRFAPDVGPFAAARDDGPGSLAALADLVPADGTLLLLEARAIVLPPGIVAVVTAAAVQLVADGIVPTGLDERIVRLGDADAAEMLALATLTKPGPFAPGTPSLGEFWGIKQSGVLVAMAGG